MIHAIGDNEPAVDESAFVAWNAELSGRVSLGRGCSVWFGAVLRGDVNEIRLGDGTNVQDGAVLHVDGDSPCIVGKGVVIGHRAVVHGCVVEDGCLIGIGAIVLNQARIGAESIVGAGSLVTQGKSFPPRSLIMGSPAKAIRALSDDEVEKIRRNAAHYAELGAEAKRSYRELRRD